MFSVSISFWVRESLYKPNSYVKQVQIVFGLDLISFGLGMTKYCQIYVQFKYHMCMILNQLAAFHQTCRGDFHQTYKGTSLGPVLGLIRVWIPLP